MLSNLLSDEPSWVGEDGKHHLVLEGYGYRWYRAGGLDYRVLALPDRGFTTTRQGAKKG